MRLFAKDRKLILEELNVYLLLLDLTLGHDLDSKCFLGVFVHAKSHETKCALTQSLTKGIPCIDILHFLEFLIITHRKLLP